MSQQPIDDHIRACRDERAGTRLLARLRGAGDDRLEPAALVWLRQWRPERYGVTTPSCTCAAGPCPVCN